VSEPIRIAQPILGGEEEAAVLETLRSGRLVQGERVAAFEDAVARELGVRHAVAVSSGTAALVVALQAHGIGPGDEVIVPAFTFAATANTVLLVGARPVFVDIRADDYCMDVEQVERALTASTKAIIPVHLYGHPCDMTALMEIAQRRGLIVIEDACQALGAEWQGRKAGSFATACLSFYATKTITTGGEGGMLLTNDDAVAHRARLLRNQGEEERYVTELLAYNFRMTEIAAAIGLAQLPKLAAWIERRRANAAWLSEHLGGGVTPVERAGARHSYQQYTVRVPWDRLQPVGPRDGLRAALATEDIETAVYYPKALHQQPLYRRLAIGGSFPVAERAAQEVLSLPVHPALSQDDLERITGAVNGALAGAGARRG
jgi:dTDP-4-amino-4,6-dideoxygalactose transaminase